MYATSGLILVIKRDEFLMDFDNDDNYCLNNNND